MNASGGSSSRRRTESYLTSHASQQPSTPTHSLDSFVHLSRTKQRSTTAAAVSCRCLAHHQLYTSDSCTVRIDSPRLGLTCSKVGHCFLQALDCRQDTGHVLTPHRRRQLQATTHKLRRSLQHGSHCTVSVLPKVEHRLPYVLHLVHSMGDTCTAPCG